jgi:mannan endo-1,4-beta-mannosidase
MRIPVIGTTMAITTALVAYIVVMAPSPVTPAPVPAAVADGPSDDASPAPEKDLRLPRLSHRPIVGITGSTTRTLDRFIADTGTTPDVFGIFEDWSMGRPLQRDIADTVADRGSRLSITWEPWDSTAGTISQPRYSLPSIIAGRHDRYIDAFARSVSLYPHRVILRFMHEMNGFWYPWASGVDGNTPAQYARAWRHVHDRFTAMGADNVRWLWAPNAVYPGAGALAPLYPGDAYVDLVGISTYNWGARRHDGVRTRWQSFGSLLVPTLQRLRQITSKPIWVAEVGSTNSGGSKAAWLAAMFRHLQRNGDIAGVMWLDLYDHKHKADWRIQTEPAAVASWRRGFEARRTIDTKESVRP